MNERLDYDADLQEKLKPLCSIMSSATNQSLKLCHRTIVPDLNESEFYTNYKIAAHLLKHYEFKTPLETLQKNAKLGTE